MLVVLWGPEVQGSGRFGFLGFQATILCGYAGVYLGEAVSGLGSGLGLGSGFIPGALSLQPSPTFGPNVYNHNYLHWPIWSSRIKLNMLYLQSAGF